MAKTAAKTRSGIQGSPEARKRATAVLEVLGGLVTPTEAAGALGIGVPRYYMLETQALEGLVKACEPRGRGPGRSQAKVIRAQADQIQRLEREVRRLQALVRVSHRALGVAALAAPAPASAGRTKGSKKTKTGRARRKPVARALGMSKLLKEKSHEPAGEGMATGGGGGGVAGGEAPLAGDPADDRR
jgi:hypothetical protein